MHMLDPKVFLLYRRAGNAGTNNSSRLRIVYSPNEAISVRRKLKRMNSLFLRQVISGPSDGMRRGPIGLRENIARRVWSVFVARHRNAKQITIMSQQSHHP